MDQTRSCSIIGFNQFKRNFRGNPWSLRVFSPIIGGKKRWALWIFQAQVRVDTLTRPHEARVKKTWRVWGKKAMAFAVNFPLNPPVAMNGKSWVFLKVQSSLIFIGARYLVTMNGGRYPPIPLVSHPGLKSDLIFLAESHIVHRCNPAPSVLSIDTRWSFGGRILRATTSLWCITRQDEKSQQDPTRQFFDQQQL